MDTKSEIVASIDAAKGELEKALAHLAELPALDWETVRCAAHILGNYVNISNACVRLLERELTDHPNQEVHTWLQSLGRTTELMIYVSRQLTNASAASDVPLVPEKVDFSLMARRAAAFYESMAKPKKLQILCDVQARAVVWAGRIALAAALDNLFSNAVKYSPIGKRIMVRVATEPGHFICTVADEGPGLTSADQARLFQRGTPLSSIPTGGESSTGFGLFIAKRLIERMGGSIGCDTAPGQGCKFSFRLPEFVKAQSPKSA